MKDTLIKKEAKALVDLTIKMHKEKLLGKEKLSKFIKSNIWIQIQLSIQIIGKNQYF